MKPFMADKRKMLELFPLPAFLALIFVFAPTPSMAIFFTFGYIWNWTVSQPLLYVQESKKYKFSTLKLVKNIHQLFLRPLSNLKQDWPKKIVALLPAGLFWGLITHSLGSDSPWWVCFLGSVVYELVDFIFNRVRPDDGPPPL